MSTRLGFRSPDNVQNLCDFVAEAASGRTPIEVRGRGSKHDVGRSVQSGGVVSTEALNGISLYQPTELVMSAGSGTKVEEIEQVLAEYDQELAFEPVDLGPALGADVAQGSIGGVFATNISGSRRVRSGSARDHLLGIKAVNGRGEPFKSGGRVMKNVTGYDLARTLAGSWGTLGILTEVTFKVVPRAKESRTLLCFGLTNQGALEAMHAALDTPFEVSGAAHIEDSLAARFSDKAVVRAAAAVTAIRVENFASSVRYRAARLKERLLEYAPSEELDTGRSLTFWQELRELKMFQESKRPLWRISAAPSHAGKIISNIRRSLDVRVVYDWAGGLIWLDTDLTTDAGAVEIRRAVAEFGGHATLIRAEPATRAIVDVFQPLDPSLMALTARLKAAFDPEGILNPGRMYAGI
jgi:glycolate oxidase FAD binding subunit